MELPAAPRGLRGTVTVPPSKSLTQRALVAAVMAGPGSVVRGPSGADDPRLLVEALRAVGYGLTWKDGAVAASGRAPVAEATLDCGNNGTGMRFLLAHVASLPGTWVVDGGPRLRERPVTSLVAALRDLGADIAGLGARPDELPLRVRGGGLRGGGVALDAAPSSQFVSALLLLGAALPGGLVVSTAARPPSRPYLDLTVEVLEAFGAPASVEEEGRRCTVAGGALRPTEFAVEGDWSAAAFAMAAVAVAGGAVEVRGLRAASRQGDAVVADLLVATGCTVRATSAGLAVEGPSRRPLVADLRDAPDLFPAMAVVVAAAGGRLTGLEGLAAKESDRLAVMTVHLRRLGVPVRSGRGWFESDGGLHAAAAPASPLSPEADHRIAMALAAAGCVVPGLRVSDPACVDKSWPGFWRQWATLVGGRP